MNPIQEEDSEIDFVDQNKEEEEEKHSLQITQQKIVSFQLGEHVDCLDSVNKWCNAEIVAVSRISIICSEKRR